MLYLYSNAINEDSDTLEPDDSQEHDTSTEADISTSEDLLSWCKNITNIHYGLSVSDMTTSWRNGMAFCALIHYFRPDLINYSELNPADIQANCKIAFDAASKLNIPKVIEPAEMWMCDVPDKLSVMTYLYQVKAHFTGEQMQFHQNVDNINESTYTFEPQETEEDEKLDFNFVDQTIKSIKDHQNSVALHTDKVASLNINDQENTQNNTNLDQLNQTKSNQTCLNSIKENENNFMDPFENHQWTSINLNSDTAESQEQQAKSTQSMTRNQQLNTFDSENDEVGE